MTKCPKGQGQFKKKKSLIKKEPAHNTSLRFFKENLPVQAIVCVDTKMRENFFLPPKLSIFLPAND